MTEMYDAVVVGAGPAGMAAAARLAEGGRSVLLVDEQAGPGGQIYRAIERSRDRPGLATILGESYAHGEALAARLRASGARLAFATTVWRMDPDRRVFLRAADGSLETVRARNLVLATGAIERPVPVDGWTLPGVMTVGALQILLKTSGLRPEGPLVLVGTGPLVYLFAAQAAAAGVDDITLLDTATFANAFAALPALPRALAGEGRSYLVKGFAMLAALRRSGVRHIRGARDIRIAADDERGLAVACHAGRRQRMFRCSMVGLHEGVIPHTHPARSIECLHRFDPVQAAFRPVLGPNGESSVAGVYVAGDAGGIGGARAAEHAGRLAAIAILRAEQYLSAAAGDAEAAAERRALAAHLTIRSFLDRVYRPADAVVAPSDETVICRCEAVTAGAVRSVVREGVVGPNQAKAFLRAGMGPCQGRLCGPTVSAIIAAATGRTMDDIGAYRIRPPLKPISLGELARLDVPDMAEGSD